MTDTAPYNLPNNVPDTQEHEKTFHVFVKAMTIFAAHVMAILLLLYLFAY